MGDNTPISKMQVKLADGKEAILWSNGDIEVWDGDNCLWLSIEDVASLIEMVRGVK